MSQRFSSRARPARKLWHLLWIPGLALVALSASSVWVKVRGARWIVPRKKAPSEPVALVFGAGLVGTSPSPVLAERLDAAVWLWRHGKVQRLLLSGNSDRHHDETGAMRRYVEKAGVPASALRVDPGGVSTFESCRRARLRFGVSSALLVTQRFHLPRALYLARAEGISAFGVAADELRNTEAPFVAREVFTRSWAWVQAIAQSLPPPGRTTSKRAPPVAGPVLALQRRLMAPRDIDDDAVQGDRFDPNQEDVSDQPDLEADPDHPEDILPDRVEALPRQKAPPEDEELTARPTEDLHPIPASELPEG